MSLHIASHADHVDQVFRGLHPTGDQVVGSQFHGCTFLRCTLAQHNLRNCRFISCTFRQSDLSLIQVPGSAFSATEFDDCKIIGVDWTQADWSGPRLAGSIGFRRCALNHSTFIGLSLHELQLLECLAVDVDFREADLTRADLAGTDLSQSLFAHTTLTEADLSQARNYQIDPGQNTLTRARFSLPEAMSLLYNMDIVLDDGLNQT